MSDVWKLSPRLHVICINYSISRCLNRSYQNISMRRNTNIGQLEFTRSNSKFSVDAIDDFKSDLHTMLRRYSQKCNIHANAKKKAAKLLSNSDASFSTSGVREFMSNFELHVETRIDANSACTMEGLKVSSIKPENSTTC